MIAKLDDFFLYNDDEQIISRNFLLFLDDRMSALAKDEESSGVSGTSSGKNQTFGGQGSDDISAGLHSSKQFDKLIIKAKVYILEILEVYLVTNFENDSIELI